MSGFSFYIFVSYRSRISCVLSSKVVCIFIIENAVKPIINIENRPMITNIIFATVLIILCSGERIKSSGTYYSLPSSYSMAKSMRQCSQWTSLSPTLNFNGAPHFGHSFAIIFIYCSCLRVTSICFGWMFSILIRIALPSTLMVSLASIALVSMKIL